MTRAFLTFIATALTSSVYAQPPTAVIVTEAKIRSVSTPIESLATVQANESVTITSTVTEHIKSIHFEDGIEVTKGQLLMSLDDHDERAILIEEQARLDEAQRQVRRLKQLTNTNAASQSALDNQLSQVAISQAKIKGIEVALNKRQIKAPFDGILGLRQLSVGALAQSGTELITIDDISTVKLDINVPEKYLSQVAIGQSILAKATAYPDVNFTGQITSINSRVDATTRAIAVRAVIQNPNRLLKPGMSMKVTIDSQSSEQLTIPEQAVLSSGTQNYVYLIQPQNGKIQAKQQNITLGQRSQGLVSVIDGLKPDQQVVIHGINRISDGSEVSITAVKKSNESLTDLLKLQPGS